jgi:hypothetical protein
MDNQLEVVELALTVLVAITEHHEPKPSDGHSCAESFRLM